MARIKINMHVHISCYVVSNNQQSDPNIISKWEFEGSLVCMGFVRMLSVLFCFLILCTNISER